VARSVFRGDQLFDKMHEAIEKKKNVSTWILVRNRNSCTLPSDASSNFTGVSRTEATKQKDAGLVGVAAGYQIKSRMGDG